MLRKRYEWRELTEGGLLRKPEDAGTHYNRESLNGWYGFETEDSAIQAFEKFSKKYDWWGRSSELVLILRYYQDGTTAGAP